MCPIDRKSRMYRFAFMYFLKVYAMFRTVFDIKRRRNNQKMRASIRREHIIVSSVENAPLTLEQRLAAYDPKRHGSEQMTTTQRLGAERW